MTYPARTAEHPRRQDEVGRDLIVRRTRDALRDRPRTDLSRQEIADYAGVTPALISYYFTDRISLFDAIAKPIIDMYCADARRVIKAKQSLSGKLRSMIELYLTFHCREGYLLDWYLHFAKQSESRAGLALLTAIEAEAAALIGELLDGKYLLGECPHAVQFVLWGMCKQVAQKSLFGRATGSTLNERITIETDLLYEFFMNGVALLLPAGPVVCTSQAPAPAPVAACRLG